MPGKRLTEQETYEKLAEYERNKDYAAMAKLVCDSFVLEGNIANSNELAMGPGFRRYFQDFGKRNGGVPSQEDKETLKSILSEVQKIRVNSIIHSAKEIEKWEKDISQGKVEELVTLKNDNKLSHKVAHDIVMKKDPEGVYVRAGVSALGNIMSEVSSSSNEWKETLRAGNDKTKEFFDCTQRIQSETIDGYITMNGSVDLDTAHKYMNEYESGAPKALGEGFAISDSIGFDDGEKLCTKMPEKYKMVEKLKSSEDYEKLISTYEKNIDDIEQIDRTAKALGRESKKLYDKITEDTYESGISKNEKFIRMQEILENLSNIGTSYKIPMGSKKLPTSEISPRHISNDLKELRQLGRDIMRDIDGLDKKEQEAAENAIKTVNSFTNNYSRHFKHVTTGKETGTTKGNVKSNLEAIEFIERQGSNRDIDLSEGQEKRQVTESMRKSSNAIDRAIFGAVEAKKGVRMGSERYDKAVEALYKLSEAYNSYRDIFNKQEVTDEEKREALANLQEAGLRSKLTIEKYFERKQSQGKMDGKADEKTQKRIDSMKEALSVTDSVLRSADDQALELDSKIAAEINEKIAEEMERTSEMIDETVGDRETRRSSNKYEAMINEAAANGAHYLADIAKDAPRKLTPAEQLAARKAMLAMAYQDFFKTDTGSKVYEGIVKKDVSPMEYDRQMLNKVASSPKFVKAVSNITHDTIVDFMTDKKAPLKLMDNYAAEKVHNAEHTATKRPSELEKGKTMTAPGKTS